MAENICLKTQEKYLQTIWWGQIKVEGKWEWADMGGWEWKKFEKWEKMSWIRSEWNYSNRNKRNYRVIWMKRE